MARRGDMESLIVFAIIVALLILGIYLVLGGSSTDNPGQSSQPVNDKVLHVPNLGPGD